jgi:pimeloyl-ACP methyl ester carboxylesterase
MLSIKKTSFQRITVALAVSLSLAPMALCYPSSEGRSAGISESPSRFAKLDGNKVHYESHGAGREALVFVHGWTCNLGFWSRQVPAFTNRTRVIAIDLPGHGQSDKPQINYTMDLFARAVDAVLTDSGVDRAVLVGHSLGTPVIREFYRKYPKKTLGLVIVDGPLRPFGDKKMMEQLMAPLRGPNYKEAVGQLVEGMLGQNTTAELRAEIKNSMLNTPQYVAVSAMDGMIDESIWKEDKIKVPVLAIMAKSPFLPADAETFYREIAPNIEYKLWDGVSHFLMMEKPKEFNEAVAGFLAKNGLLKK